MNVMDGLNRDTTAWLTWFEGERLDGPAEQLLRRWQLATQPREPEPAALLPCPFTAEQVLERCAEALIWVTGHGDFGQGGQYREGWLKVGQPALDAVLYYRRAPHPDRAQLVVETRAWLSDQTPAPWRTQIELLRRWLEQP